MRKSSSGYSDGVLREAGVKVATVHDFDTSSRSEKRRSPGRTALLRDGGAAREVSREELKALCNQVGSYFPQRENFRLTPEVKAKFTEKLKSDPKEFCGHKVSEMVRTDGLKLVFEDGSWVCYWLSGTEPVVRVYSEARSERGLEKLSITAKQWIFD